MKYPCLEKEQERLFYDFFFLFFFFCVVDFLFHFWFYSTWERAQVVGGDLLPHRKTFSKEQPFPQAAKLWFYPLLSWNRLYSQIPSAKNADLSNLRHRAGDTQSALTLCSLPARPLSLAFTPAPWPRVPDTAPFLFGQEPMPGAGGGWRAAGGPLPAARGCSVLRSFMAIALSGILSLLACPARISPCCITECNVASMLEKPEIAPPLHGHLHPGLHRVSQKNAAVSAQDHFCKTGEKIDFPLLFLIYLFVA